MFFFRKRRPRKDKYDGKVLKPSLIFERLILAGGPPRSGTTLLAKILNNHECIAVAIDNSRFESWGLYYYRYRTGLCSKLRSETLETEEIRQHLLSHLIENGHVRGISPSRSVSDCPPTKYRPALPLGNGPFAMAHGRKKYQDPLGRKDVPLIRFKENLRLCLKSPEILFFLKILSQAFPKAVFVLVHRPIIEIAESMYRKGFEWNLASYHRRWAQERDEQGNLVAPPGVPDEWKYLWGRVTDFQRCVIYATSYLRALVEGVSELPKQKWFLYHHPQLVRSPRRVLENLAEFLEVEASGFLSYEGISRRRYHLRKELIAQYNEVSSTLGASGWEAKAHGLENR